MLRQTMVKAANDTSDELSLKRLAQQKFVDHERSLQEERSVDPERFSSQGGFPGGGSGVSQSVSQSVSRFRNASVNW